MPVELLIVDSGSTDGSLDIARRHGARVIEIPQSEFSHGLTRNLAIEEATGDVVVFLTQDSTPASDRWLASMLEGFAQSDDVALVFGPHIARPEHSHVFAREMRDHFRTWGDGERIDVQRLGPSPQALADYRAFPGKLQFFSDVNGAVARWAWERIPYRGVAVRGGPDAGAGDDRGRIRQGLPPGRRRLPLARLPAAATSCAATSTSTAACARCSVTWSPSASSTPRAPWST